MGSQVLGWKGTLCLSALLGVHEGAGDSCASLNMSATLSLAKAHTGRGMPDPGKSKSKPHTQSGIAFALFVLKDCVELILAG